MKGPLLPGEHADTIRNTPANYQQREEISRLVFNESYDSEGLTPQQIREDFLDLVAISDYYNLLTTLCVWLSADQLAEFIDDRMIGRI